MPRAIGGGESFCEGLGGGSGSRGNGGLRLFSRGGWSVIRRSGPVSSGGFRSNTWSGPQDGPPIPIVLWISVTETSEWKTLTAVLCRVCFPSARIWFTSPAGDSGPGPISHGRSLMLEDDRSGSKRLHTDTDTILLLFGKNEQTKKVFWSVFIVLAGFALAQVVDPQTAQAIRCPAHRQRVMKNFPFFSSDVVFRIIEYYYDEPVVSVPEEMCPIPK